MKTRRRNEQGAGTILVLGVALAVLTSTLLAVVWATISLTAHRANAAADLTALSAAQVAADIETGPSTDPCTTARRIAELHEVELRSCQVEDQTVTVAVTAQLRLGSIGSPDITARARAGPAPDPVAHTEGADWNDDG